MLLKILGYGILILLVLEGLVRVFHLHKGTPERMIDERGVEKWVPGQTGHVTTANRRQNYAEYNINSFGFNSYREFTPTDKGYEVALIGDSFIEGFHQDYDRSIGKKIEEQLSGIAVYEFGYAGYDLADELHLIQAYPEVFEKIDKIFVYLYYPDDLLRDRYKVSEERIRLQRGIYGIVQHSKLLVYLQNIGLLSSVTNRIIHWKNSITGNTSKPAETESEEIKALEGMTLYNLKQLMNQPELNWDKVVFLLDANLFPEELMQYLKISGIPFVDYGKALRLQEAPVTLIYDQHWNDLGRDLVASEIASYLKSTTPAIPESTELSVHKE